MPILGVGIDLVRRWYGVGIEKVVGQRGSGATGITGATGIIGIKGANASLQILQTLQTLQNAWEIYLVLPAYLFRFFCRDEFDREVRFNSWGSATELFNWEDMQAISINLPPISDQHRIVSEYQTVERRIANNEALIKKLEETAQAIYHHTFVEGIDEENLPKGWKKGKLSEVVTFKVGGDKPKVFSETKTDVHKVPIYSNGVDMEGLYGYTDKPSVTRKSITISARGNVGTCFLRNKPYVGIVRLVSVIPLEESYLYYLYFELSSRNMEGDGSAQKQITVPQLKVEDVLVPPTNIVQDFYTKMNCIYSNIENVKEENIQLRKLLTLLTSKLA